MPKKRGQPELVGEELKIAVTLALRNFKLQADQAELEFPSSLTANERAYVHLSAARAGFRSKSRGKAAARCLTVYKRDGSSIVQADARFHLVRASRQHINSLLSKQPLSNRERQDLLPPTERDRLPPEVRQAARTTGRLNSGVPQVPPPPPSASNADAVNTGSGLLPVRRVQDELAATVARHQVTLLLADTGSGKTTQLPQILLEQYGAAGVPVRIVCTQPRRLAALSVAERVACERAEPLGHTVGYQIRLESRVSPKTLLTFCTCGVLIRTLMSCGGGGGVDATLAQLTHVIVDEVHERDRFSDILLTVLRDQLPRHRQLKLVLMSACGDETHQLFARYFPGAAVVRVPGRQFEVRQLYLEEVLRDTGYWTDAMTRARASLRSGQLNSRWLSDMMTTASVAATATGQPPSTVSGVLPAATLATTTTTATDCTSVEDSSTQTKTVDSCQATDKPQQANEETKDEWRNTSGGCTGTQPHLDQCISDAWLVADEAAFSRLLATFITTTGADQLDDQSDESPSAAESVAVDYQHSETAATALMVAAGRGRHDVVEQLLTAGASLQLRAANGWTARDWAAATHQTDVLQLLESLQPPAAPAAADKLAATSSASSEQLLSDELVETVRCYQLAQTCERDVDVTLLVALLGHVCSRLESGGVLVFLSGYDAICRCRAAIVEAAWFQSGPSSAFSVLALHSSLATSEQRRVFVTPPPSVRKIVLATDIAETSVTIEDIVCVIDSCRVKENVHDPLTGVSTLTTGWASQESAVQRAGRAGRCRAGVCYRLLTRATFASLPPRATAELLCMPLQQVCLHAKLLAPPNMAIAEFLSRAPEPPPFTGCRAAVQLLKSTDALDPWEDLTELGYHLLGLPIEPQLAKAVVLAVVLKCLDPVLTIVCCLAHRDPFVLATSPEHRLHLRQFRRRLAANSLSDHMTLLRCFQAWQRARADGCERQFCRRNCVSAAVMETVVAMRAQLLGQLRASGFVRARGAGDIRDLNCHSENWAVVKAAMCGGAYPRLARIDREHQLLRTQRESRVMLHPDSILSTATTTSTTDDNSAKSARSTAAELRRNAVASLPVDWLIFEEIRRADGGGGAGFGSRRAVLRCCTVVTPVCVALMAGPSRMPLDAVAEADAVLRGLRGDAYLDEDSDSGAENVTAASSCQSPSASSATSTSVTPSSAAAPSSSAGSAVEPSQRAMLRLDEWLWFSLDSDAAHLALQLRQKWHALLVRRLRAPGRGWSPADEAVLRALVAVLTAEEHAAGLQQPSGVGQRPRPVASADPAQSPALSSADVTINLHHHQLQQQQFQHVQQGFPASPLMSESRPSGSTSSYQHLRGVPQQQQQQSHHHISSFHQHLPHHHVHQQQQQQATSPSVTASPANCRYFAVKTDSVSSVERALQSGVWCAAGAFERRLVQCVRDGVTPLLLFSCVGSSSVLAVARFTAVPAGSAPSDALLSPNTARAYQVQWLRPCEDAVSATTQNARYVGASGDDEAARRLAACRDGQEVVPHVALSACRRWLSPSQHDRTTAGGGGGGGYGCAQSGVPAGASFTGRAIRGKTYTPSSGCGAHRPHYSYMQRH